MKLLDALRALFTRRPVPGAAAPAATPGAVPVHVVGEAPRAPLSAAPFIAEWEGFRAKPYLCPANVPTIGFGTTRYPDGRAVTMDDPACTRAQALEWLAHDIRDAEAAVRLHVQVPLTEGQRVALVSFVYNVGAGAFSRSTLLRLLNRGDYGGAEDQLHAWVLAKGVKLPGLVRRRAAEAALFRGAA